MPINTKSPGIRRQVWHFFLHLRLHYQFGILSGGFLLGGFLSPGFDFPGYAIQFANVHILLFGGATAYNSYWDRDEGPVGGLKNPPQMASWMWSASLLFLLSGLLLSTGQGVLFASIYLLSILFFWLYSTPLARWKSRPVKSLFAIGISTGFNSVLLGYLSASGADISFGTLVAAAGVTLVMLSLYPTSQIYQREVDTERGDLTFAVKYGIKGVIRFFESAYFCGVLLITAAIGWIHMLLGIMFGILGMITGLLIRRKLLLLTAGSGDYPRVMRIKYATSLAFVIFLLGALILKHLEISGISSVADLLLK